MTSREQPVVSSSVLQQIDRLLAREAVDTSPERAFALLNELEAVLATVQSYPIDLARRIEGCRNRLLELSKDVRPKASYMASTGGPPKVTFGVTADRVQFVDPTNGTFAIQCEASVGVTLDDAVGYLTATGRPMRAEELLARVSNEGLLWLDDPLLESRLAALLRVRVIHGEMQSHYEYFRYGTKSGAIWLIQSFTVQTWQGGDFANLPFDRFDFVVDFAVGLGGDVANVEVQVDKVHEDGRTLFATGFNAGEFSVDRERGALFSFGYLQDPTCYFQNLVRLRFELKRDGWPLLGRIVLPQLLMMVLLAWSNLVPEVVSVATQVVPALFLAMVALQLTAAQGMPRSAPFSKLDRLFVLSYIIILGQFVASVAWGALGWKGACVVAGAYALVAPILLARRRREQRWSGFSSPSSSCC